MEELHTEAAQLGDADTGDHLAPDAVHRDCVSAVCEARRGQTPLPPAAQGTPLRRPHPLPPVSPLHSRKQVLRVPPGISPGRPSS